MKRSLVILTILIVLNALALGGLWYAYVHIHAMRESQKQLQVDIAQESMKGTRAAQQRRSFAQLEVEYAKLMPYFYGTKEESQLEFISDIEQLGKVAGVELTTTNVSLTGEPKVLRLDYQIKGVWPRAHHFLRLLETYPARIAITRLDVQAESNSKTYDPTRLVNMSVGIDLISIMD